MVNGHAHQRSILSQSIELIFTIKLLNVCSNNTSSIQVKRNFDTSTNEFCHAYLPFYEFSMLLPTRSVISDAVTTFHQKLRTLNAWWKVTTQTDMCCQLHTPMHPKQSFCANTCTLQLEGHTYSHVIDRIKRCIGCAYKVYLNKLHTKHCFHCLWYSDSIATSMEL